ncbi:hypothetical protein [Kitasatospora sp. NPDC088351]|uniref:hypothetical protein n=1 Tax=Kitasatospora sp. NPDC088351 TaxID=3155180 RepID=UPI00341783DC
MGQSRTLRWKPTLAALAAVWMTALAGPAPSAAAADEPTAPAAAPVVNPLSPTAGQFQLTDTSYAAATDSLLKNHLGKPVGLGDVISTNFTTNSAGRTDGWLNLRQMGACAGTETAGLPPADVAKKTAWCWSSAYADDTTEHWYPQGLSTTGTADGGDGAIQGQSVAAVSWHYKAYGDETSAGCKTDNLLKLTFIDRTTRKYRHVLLAEPTSTSATASDFTFVKGHGGGIAWYANYIYVTDTAHGIRVFDINKLAKVDTYGSDVSTVGISNGKSSACGYPYVLPEVHRYFQAKAAPSCAATGPIDAQSLCFSWLSLDKTGGGSTFKLVTGEWYGQASGARVVRYQLNPASAATGPGLLKTSGGRTVVQDAFTADGYRGLQGGMTWTDDQGALNFAFSKGCGTKPAVFSHTWTGDTRPVTTCGSGDARTGNWGAGSPQALSYWPVLGTTRVDELWGLTEGICRPKGHPHFTAGADDTGVCTDRTATTITSLRTVFAVGFTDPQVQNRH